MVKRRVTTTIGYRVLAMRESMKLYEAAEHETTDDPAREMLRKLKATMKPPSGEGNVRSRTKGRVDKI